MEKGCIKCGKSLITNDEIYCSSCKAGIKQKMENIARLDKFKKV